MDTGDQLSSCRHPYPSAQAMYTAAERWRDEALIGDRSLFDGRLLDGVTAGRELVEHFVSNPDVGSGTFVTKLRDQLATVSADTVQVAAELLYLHFLIVSTDAVSSRKKLETITSVLAFRETGTTSVPEDMAEALRGGVAHPGQAFNNFRWKMFGFLIEFFVAVKALPVDERRAALKDRSRVQAIFGTLDQQTVWSQMWALEHLLFPDLTPPMLNRDDRAEVVATWPDLGRDAAEVLRRLEPNAQYGQRTAVMPYRTPYRSLWKGADAALTTYVSWSTKVLDSGIDQLEVELGFKRELAAALRETLEMAERGEPLDDALRTIMARPGFNLIHYYVVDDFRKWVKDHAEEAQAALREFSRFEGAEAMDRFLSHLPRSGQLKGDGARISLASVFLMAVDPENFPPYREQWVRATRRLTTGYRPQESATEGEQYVLFLEWMDQISEAMATVGRPLENRLVTQSLAYLVIEWKEPGWDASIYQAFDAWRTGKQVKVKEPQPKAGQAKTAYPEDSEQLGHDSGGPRTLEELGDRLSLADGDLDWLEETVELLREKRQLILQGPPGTGKTFVARELATFVAGSAEGIELVQFHPSYSYEDFVTGLRPDPDRPGRFSLVAGPLVRLAERARTEPSQPFVLLIDEINRANVPAVFGELYYLLEYRDKTITMTYGGEPFALPENLLIIGTMNTADRSITTLDSAMRRRFYVRDLRPGEAPVDGMLRRYLARHAEELTWLADVLDEANKIVDDRDLAIGPSYFMGDPPTEKRARREWQNSVLPTLSETFYNRPGLMDGLGFTTLKDRVTGTVTDDAAD